MGEVVATLYVDAERMLEQLEQGFSQATDLAEYVMVECEVDYRTAYSVVGRTVRTASKRGLRGLDITGMMLDKAAEELLGHALGLAGRDLSDVLDPRAIVRTRDAAGGAAPEVVRQMSLACRVKAEEWRQHAAARGQTFTESESELLRQAKEVADG
jgi:argininosuccinate lyase